MRPTIKTLLNRGVEEVIIRKDVEAALRSGKKLRVKFGIDPTLPDLHLGHAVLLRKLRQFQDAGHKAILIIGDFTALIGDPSGRAGTRQPLTPAQVKKNMKKYLEQAGKILNLKKLEIKYNGQWLKKIKLTNILNLQSQFTVPQLTEREDFKKRIEKGLEVGGHELTYTLMQAYDSVEVKADLELGGRDQKLNLLAGRHLMGKLGMKPQDILTAPLLEGTDGIHKMSKTFGNYIGLTEDPQEMFNKIMSIPDKVMPKYFETLTDIDVPMRQLKKNPRNSKLLLAKIIVADLYDKKTAVRSMASFVSVFSNKELPKSIPALSVLNGKATKTISLIDLLVRAGVESRSEARRLIKQGGVRLDSEVQKDMNLKIKIKKGVVLQIGKKRFFRLS